MMSRRSSFHLHDAFILDTDEFANQNVHGYTLEHPEKLLASHFAAVLLVSGSLGSFLYYQAAESLTESVCARFCNTANLIGQMLEGGELDDIRTVTCVTLPTCQRALHGRRSPKEPEDFARRPNPASGR